MASKPKKAAFLRANGPWSQMVEIGNLDLVETPPGESFRLENRLEVVPVRVPHRDEYSDTVGFLLRGPRKTLLYVPDTDGWDAWERPLARFLAEEKVDHALLDGTFFSLDELPGRDIASVKHPLIRSTMDLLAPLVKKEGTEVRFLHLNHSNPALDPASPEREEILSRGVRVALEGEELEL